MKRKYDLQIEDLTKRKKAALQRPSEAAALQTSLERESRAILSMETESDVFCKSIVKSLTVFRDRHLELRLKELSHVFWFTDCP